MKILIINYRYHFTGGPERYMFNIIEEFGKLGHEVVNFSVSNANNYPSEFSNYFADNIANSNEYLYEDYNKTFQFYILIFIHIIILVAYVTSDHHTYYKFFWEA